MDHPRTDHCEIDLVPDYKPQNQGVKASIMAPKDGANLYTNERGSSHISRSTKKSSTSIQEKPTDYTSHGVTDNDIFMLPSSDFQLLGILTVVAAVVRLFRIYQPSSVVFDEVQ